MARKTGSIKDMAVFFLTPELSSQPVQRTVRTGDETTSQTFWWEPVKTVVWIIVSIMLALVLGQLH